MPADDAAVVVSLRADLKAYESALKTAVRQTERAAQAAEKAVSGVGKNARPDFRAMNDNFRRATRQMENDARASQSRIQRMFAGIAAGPKLGPLGALTAGISLGGAQSILDSATQIENALRTAGLEGDQLSKTFADLANIAKQNGASFESLAKLYSRVSQSQKELGLSGEQVLDFTEKIAVALKAAGTDSASASAGIQQLTQALASGVLRGDEFNSIMENLPTVARAIAAGLNVPIGALRTMAEEGELTATTVVAAFERGFSSIADDASKAETTIGAAFQNLRTALIEAAAKFDEATGASDEFVKFLNQDLTQAINSIVKIFAALGEAGVGSFIRDLDNKRIQLENFMREIGRSLGVNFLEGWGAAVSQDQIQSRIDAAFGPLKTDLPAELPPLEINVDDKSLKESMKLIAKFENFITHAKWDVNAFRAGFGSDTFVDEMGNVQRVTKDTVVTFEQATADLARRTREFQQTVIGQIGGDVWKSLEKNQKAALTSIAYNYGSLPASIVRALEAGDTGKVAQAIAALGSDNAGINRKRRLREAEIFGGTEFSTRAEKQSYDELVQSINAKIEAQGRENAINADSTRSTDDRTAALAREKAAQEAATVAKQLDAATVAQYGSITDEQREKNRQLAEQYAATGLKAEELSLRNERLAESQRIAAAEADKLKEAQRRARDALVDTLASMATSAITGFVQDLRNGVSAAEALYNAISRIADQLLQMALQAAFKSIFSSILGGFSGGGFVGGRGGLYASGGYTGDRPVQQPVGIVHGGEFVINAQATQRHRDLLEAINRGFPGYAAGGFVLPNIRSLLHTPAAERASMVAQSGGPRTTVVNTFDAGSFLSEALSRPDGVNVILNAVRAQPGAFRTAMQG